MESVASRQIFTAEQWQELRQDLSLTDRQAQIVELLLAGQADKQIAFTLQMSMGTLRTHFSRLFRRFGVQDRFEFITSIYAHFLDKCQMCNCPRFR
ncbi:MAG: helix-turn-helix transcriptional regulator [Planctomycetes bacterium]|nr:helix-turn-helix transcriptional regulator [Planctomycetota bacterium]